VRHGDTATRGHPLHTAPHGAILCRSFFFHTTRGHPLKEATRPHGAILWSDMRHGDMRHGDMWPRDTPQATWGHPLSKVAHLPHRSILCRHARALTSRTELRSAPLGHPFATRNTGPSFVGHPTRGHPLSAAHATLVLVLCTEGLCTACTGPTFVDDTENTGVEHPQHGAILCRTPYTGPPLVSGTRDLGACALYGGALHSLHGANLC
jgi:hypothetical protein